MLGRLSEFGSGARLSRRFRAGGSDDRLHWNLRARCYVRRTKQQVLPQLPAKRHDTVPGAARPTSTSTGSPSSDVIAWLQTLPLDLRTLDAKVAAALRAEQLVRLNNLRQLAARGKLPDGARLDRATSSPPASRSSCSPSTSPSSGPCSSASPTPRTSSARDSTPQPPARRRRLPARGRPAADRLLDEGGVAGHHAHARLERRLPGARLDARPATTRPRTACTGSARRAP